MVDLFHENACTPGCSGKISRTAMHATITLQLQVMSESVASALEYLDNDATQQTRLFIRMIDKFFDCLNAKGPQVAKLKRKDNIAPYSKASDARFTVRTKPHTT